MEQQAQTGEKHILFVDDEPGVLRALRRALRRRSEWKLSFADGADHALEQMATTPFDIVVSDVTMPRTDGVTFLRQVRSDYPDALRVLMSGAAPSELLLQAVPVAHRFFSKPWDLALLIAELDRAFELRDKLSQVAIRGAIGGLSSPPVLPAVLRALGATLADPASRLHDVVGVIEQDPSMVARVLQIVNSAFFSEARVLIDTSEAIRYLGTSRLKSLLQSGETFRVFDDTRLPSDVSLAEFQTHALLTAEIACNITPGDPDRARNAGLLHSIGKLILVDHMPERWGDAHRQARHERRALHEVEYEHFGTTYADVGAYLLGIWGLPQDVVQAVAQHCAPMRGSDGTLNLMATTHLASVLAAQQLGLAGQDFDSDLLETLDGERHMPSWRAIAANVARG